MSFKFANWRRLTESGIVMVGPCLLYSVHGVVSQAGVIVAVYDGLDAVSGNQVFAPETTGTLSNGINFDPPLYFNRGIYITAGDDMTSVLISYREIDDDPFKLERSD